MKKVLIIIINYNGINDTLICINSLKKTLGKFKVCIVDNGSKNKEYLKLKKLKSIYFIKNKKNKGFAGANNQAIKKHKNFDYYLLLNNDTKIIENDWLNKLVCFCDKNKKIGICGPKLLNSDGSIQKLCGKLKPLGMIPIKGNKIEEVDWVSGAAFLIKKEVINKIGFLDEIYNPAYYEETDFCLRAKKAGFKIFYYPQSKLIHYQGNTTNKEKNKLNWIKQRNKLLFIKKNFPPKWLLIRIPWEVLVFLKETFKEKKIPKQYKALIGEIK